MTLLVVNGSRVEVDRPDDTPLLTVLRDALGLVGTRFGCGQGLCGACTVLVEGRAVRSCLMLAVQADGCTVRTIEGLAAADGTLHPMQAALWEHHGLQCGFCTPGMLTTLVGYLETNPDPTEREIREAISGNICRCTGYQAIVEAGLADRRLTALGRRPANARTAALFVELYDRLMDRGMIDGGEIAVPVTHEQLADALGLTAVYISRTLQLLNKEGLARFERGTLVILDLRGLRLLGGGSGPQDDGRAQPPLL